MTMSTFENVLIVDDDPILRTIAYAYFGALGTPQILQASNGREALDLLQQYRPAIDFILCDLNMPELDGVQFLRQLKDCAFSGAIAILSGEDRAVLRTARELAQSLGLDIVGALRKPLKAGDLDQLLLNRSPGKPAHQMNAAAAVSQSELAQAIAGGQIVPFYQPKVDASSGRIVGVEALARWIHPGSGMISPDNFIPLAEECHLIGGLTDVILEQTLADLKHWQAAGITVSAAINIAADLLHDIDLPDRLSARIDAAELSSSDLVLEVTESGILQQTCDPMEVLTRLRIKGFALSVDDFGTGHSNLEQLSKFPFCELKIDRSFVKGARTDRSARAIIDALVLLGRELDMRLVAEGVETEWDWQFIAQHGIDQVQGFYVAKPMPAGEFEQWHSGHDGVFDVPPVLRAKSA